MKAIAEVLAGRAQAAEAGPKTKPPTPKSPPSESKSAYDILKVRKGSTRAEIVTAYREIVKLYHPDKVASLAPEFQVIAEMRTKEINTAYQELLSSL